MPETIDTVIGRISYLTQHNFRGRLGSRGTARSMVWRNGALPEGSPAYGEELTEELLSYGFSLLRVALKAYELEVYSPEVRSAFEISAEAIEAVIKNGDPEDEAKGFYRVLAASAYHLGGFAARAFSLASKESNGNYAQVEIALSLLILRRLEDLQRFLLDQINSLKHQRIILSNSLSPKNLASSWMMHWSWLQSTIIFELVHACFLPFGQMTRGFFPSQKARSTKVRKTAPNWAWFRSGGFTG